MLLTLCFSPALRLSSYFYVSVYLFTPNNTNANAYIVFKGRNKK